MKHEKFRYKSVAELIAKTKELGIQLPWSDSSEELLQPTVIAGIKIPNRLTVQPMEGFDSDENGTPGDLAFRRYGRYAEGGSGMIWLEAVSVVPDGRSNLHQMMITKNNVHQFKKLTDHIRRVASDTYGVGHRPFLVIQLTHSGRYSKSEGDFMPKIFSDNPYLADPSLRAGLGARPELTANNLQPTTYNLQPSFYTDAEIDTIKLAYINAIGLAEQAGFDAVDVKACHGYLLHEMLFAYDRTDSRYGGSFENRTRFLREVLNAPAKILKAFRLSAYDMIPYPYGFGMKTDGSCEIDLTEVKKLIAEFAPMVPLWNISAGIPRYNAHIGRPFDRGVFNAPPPKEHPLYAIDRLIRVTGELQHEFPDLHFVGSGYSWLRQFYPNVGAGAIAAGMATFVGLGRSSFAYPDSPKDLMQNGNLDPKKVCVSCSKCTEFMRLGVATGCAVRDPAYQKNKKRSPVNSAVSNGVPAFAGMTSALREVTVNTLIIGSGAAALNAALCLWESGVRDILIVTEKWGGGTSNNAGSDKQTYYKLSMDPSIRDSVNELAADLCRGGAMHGDIALCEAQHSAQAFYNLVRLGVPFPHNQYGAYPGYKTDHDPSSRATSAGPLTSHLMFECLAGKVKEYGIPVCDRIDIIELLTREEEGSSRISGAIGMDKKRVMEEGHGLIVYHADRVILATGGPGGMYKYSVYPLSQTGSTGMALKIGARAQNLSISQFGIASVKFRWNLSGSYQQVIPRYYSTDPDGNEEHEFLMEHFPDLETLCTAIFLKGYQWPFDPKKVKFHGSSMIDLLVQQETGRNRKVFIDFTRNPHGFSLDKLQPVAHDYLEKSGALADTPIERLKLINQPAIDLYHSHGIDITREPLEIAVCAQHSNGGLSGDIWWESNIRGLYPIGEVNGAHGITRPGGAALNSGQVGGIRATMKITAGCRLQVAGNGLADTGHQLVVPGHQSPATGSLSRVSQLLTGNGNLDFRDALAELQQRMSDFGGPVRDRKKVPEQISKAWVLWDRMNNDLKAVEATDLPAAIRALDLCLTHAVYLEAILEYLDKSDNEEFVKNNILEIGLDKQLKLQKEWVPVRPIPKEDLWFEEVWRMFNLSTNTDVKK